MTRGRGTLTFNGEVWNFRELRAELEAEGCVFETEGDTEVVAWALSAWGPAAALPRMEGMFSIAWAEGDEVWLARDRYGKVPLFVARSPNGWAWSSEMKALPPMGVQPRASRALPPATLLRLSDGQMARWYQVPEQVPKVDLLAELRAGVERRASADAEVCFLVSGGLDSSLILALAVDLGIRPTAYTAIFDEGASDLRWAREICSSLDVPLREVRVGTPTPARAEVAVRAIESPMKAQVEIAMLCLPLAEQIAKDGFKVVLSGEAADELFGGYGNLIIKARKGGDAGWRNLRLSALEKMSRGNFQRCNMVFMAHGVECRLPFMERGVVEWALASGLEDCPPGKKALKQIARGLLPDRCINRPKDTFQGGSGLAARAADLIAHPTRFYNATFRKMYG